MQKCRYYPKGKSIPTGLPLRSPEIYLEFLPVLSSSSLALRCAQVSPLAPLVPACGRVARPSGSPCAQHTRKNENVENGE
jgi:hypothetical protein